MGARDSQSTHLDGVFLARPARPAYNAEGRFQGLGPVGLNARGRRQAASSPTSLPQRTFLSCGPVHSCEPDRRPRSSEADRPRANRGRAARRDRHRRLTDRTFAESSRQDPQGFAAYQRADPDWGYPGGETFRHQTERLMEALGEIAQRPTPILRRLPRPWRFALVPRRPRTAAGCNPERRAHRRSGAASSRAGAPTLSAGWVRVPGRASRAYVDFAGIHFADPGGSGWFGPCVPKFRVPQNPTTTPCSLHRSTGGRYPAPRGSGTGPVCDLLVGEGWIAAMSGTDAGWRREKRLRARKSTRRGGALRPVLCSAAFARSRRTFSVSTQ